MPIKKVLLPIDGGDDAAPLAEIAFQVATKFSAKVEALHAESAFLSLPFTGEGTDAATMRRLIEQAQAEKAARAAGVRAAFDRWAGRFAKVESALVSREGPLDDIFAQRGRLADICVVGSARTHAGTTWRAARDAMLFRSGRPVLVAPARGGSKGGGGFDKVLIAWKEGLEAARAVAAALPFVASASEVHLVAVGEGEATEASLRDVEEYVQLHFAELRCEAVPASARRAGEVILERAEGLGGALVAMGAYGHWRWQERVFGGVTEFMLNEATVPVLMTH